MSTTRRWAKAVVRTASGAVPRLVGVDGTMTLGRGGCVVVAPHPDDETFGCGATIARLRAAGSPVWVVVVSDGRRSPRPPGVDEDGIVALRRREAEQALDELGVDRQAVTHLGIADGTLEGHVEEIAERLRTLCRRVAPALVLGTSVHDRHPDHAAVGRAVRGLAEEVAVAEYAIWQRVPAANLLRDRCRPVLVSTAGHLATKQRAIDAYASQLPHLPAGFVADFLRGVEVFSPVAAPTGTLRVPTGGPPPRL